MSLPTDILEPLILADGTKIDPSSGKVIKEKRQTGFIEIPSASEAVAIVAKTRRSATELPLPPSNMNAMSLVLFYTMWGLGDADIAITSGLSLEQVKSIKKIDAYKKFFTDITNSVLEQEAGDIRSFFKQKARTAAEKIVEIAEDDDGVLGFKASQDILDRAGFRPSDVVEHRHTMENALQIEYIRNDPIEKLTPINTEFKVIE